MKILSLHLVKTRAMLCFALAITSFVDLAALEPVGEDEFEKIESQRRILTASDLWNFFAIAQSNRWDAPKIHSQCWVDWLPRGSDGSIRLEQAKRDFGLEIVKAIEREAMRIVDPASTTERVRQANQLLDFADWIVKPVGYGNLAIAMRIENLACIPIGHLVADLDYPVEKSEALVQRLGTEAGWVRMQSAILNEESPHAYDAETKKELQTQWNENLRNAWLAFKAKEGRFPHYFTEGKNFPKEIAFYCEDKISQRPHTLSTKWNTKRHYIFCVMGYEDAIVEQLKNLLLFRKTIGRFPEMPSRPLGMFDSRIQEGFYEAWKPHEETKGIHPGASGYTYEAIRRGSFMDYDTSELVASRGTKKVSSAPDDSDKKPGP